MPHGYSLSRCWRESPGKRVETMVPGQSTAPGKTPSLPCAHLVHVWVGDPLVLLLALSLGVLLVLGVLGLHVADVDVADNDKRKGDVVRELPPQVSGTAGVVLRGLASLEEGIALLSSSGGCDRVLSDLALRRSEDGGAHHIVCRRSPGVREMGVGSVPM